MVGHNLCFELVELLEIMLETKASPRTPTLLIKFAEVEVWQYSRVKGYLVLVTT